MIYPAHVSRAQRPLCAVGILGELRGELGLSVVSTLPTLPAMPRRARKAKTWRLMSPGCGASQHSFSPSADGLPYTNWQLFVVIAVQLPANIVLLKRCAIHL